MPFTLTSEGRSLKILNSHEQNSNSLIIEKENLLCVFKLVIKDLLDSSLRRERILEKEHFALRHFFIVFEHILLHGYNGKRSFTIGPSSNRKDLWHLIDLISRKSSDTHISEISTSTKEMTNIRTSLGRVRAWLRLALMQKHLADYFKILTEQKQELQELYDNEAILLSDESIIITGLLVGLNVLDFNFCLKEMILDHPIDSTIHYSIYLRERRLPSRNTHPPGAIVDPLDELDDYSSLGSASPPSARQIGELNDDTVMITNSNDVISLDEGNTDSSYDQRVSNILDQKNYLEELNRNLQKTVTTLQDRLQKLEQSNRNFIEESTVQKSRIEQLGGELTRVTAEKEQIQTSYQRRIETLNADITVERETFRSSRTGFDLMYNELQKKYEEERTSKQKIENAYQIQLLQNNEYLQSMKNMEKDIQAKTTLSDRTKEEKICLTEKLEIENVRNNEREQRIQTLEKDNQMLRETISELERNLERTNHEIHSLRNENQSLIQALTKLDGEKTSLETDLHVEQDFHQRLQTALTNEKDKVSTLQFDIHELNLMKQDYERYKKEMMKKEANYVDKLQGQEMAIQELAIKLEGSLKREDEFREKDGLRSSTWAKDVRVKACGQCQREFGALRRKHHCRSCGQIFCESCVNTKMTLASSNKPVRVCDTCRDHVLAQCAVNNP